MTEGSGVKGLEAAWLTSVPVLYLTLDPENRIRYLNQWVEKVTGWNQKWLQGKRFDEIFHPNSRTDRNLKDLLIGKGNGPFETRFKNRWGNEKTVLWTAGLNQGEGRQSSLILIGIDTTERNNEDRVRLKLQERASLGKREWRTLFDGITDMLMILKPDFTVKKTNRATSEIFSLPLERILGKPCYELCQKEKRTVSSCPVPLSIQLKKPVSGEVFSSRIQRYLLATSYPILDRKGNVESVIVYHKDLTRIKQAQEKLEKTNSLLEALIDSSESAVLMTDEKGKIVIANKKFYELFEIDHDITLKSRQDVQDLMERSLTNAKEFNGEFHFVQDHKLEHLTNEIHLVTPAKEKAMLRQTVPVTDKKGAFIGQLELYTDITEIRKMQAETQHTEKLVALGEMVAGVAHELNNPLATISGFCQLLLLRRDLNEDIERDLKKIASEGERARRIVENLLSFARYHEPEIADVNLPEVMDGTLNLLEYELKGTDIEIVKRYNEPIPTLKGDPYQLQEVFLNIIKNAIYELKGLDQKRTITIMIEKRERAIEIRISDNGRGIPRDKLKKIFEPFFTTKPPGQGTGLGLSVSFGIVHRHGGAIYARNRSSGGAEFVIRLPIDHTFRGGGKKEATERGMDKKRRLAGKALVVDDEGFVLELLQRFLEQEGMQVITARDGTEAENLLETPYDIVILDLVMPKKTGDKLFEELQKRGNPNTNRILFLSGDSVDPNTLTFLKNSGRPYLFKPFKLEDLRASVAEILEKRA